MQTALADRLVDLGEEMLWRKVSGTKLNSLTDLYTDLPLDVLIDETLPGFSYLDELAWLANNGIVEGGAGGRDVVDGSDSRTNGEASSENNKNGKNLDGDEAEDSKDGLVLNAAAF